MFRAARGLSLKKSIKKTSCILKHFPRCARHSFKQYIKNELDITSPLGGVVEEIGHFQRRMLSIRSHGSFFWHHLLGAMLRKLAIFKVEKYVHMVPFFLQEGKLLMHGQKNLYQGTRQGYLNENGKFNKGNQSCMITQLHMGRS